MLKDADSKAKPKKYVQNKCHGIYEGTIGMRDFASERCSAPKAARGSAKHKLPRATTLSSPPASARSVLDAHSPISKIMIAAADMETGTREISRNAARMIGGIRMPRLRSRWQRVTGSTPR